MFDQKVAAARDTGTDRATPQSDPQPEQPRGVDAAAVLALQRSVGNSAVTSMLARSPEPESAGPGELTVADAGRDLRERLETYATAVPSMRRLSVATHSIEDDWAAKRNNWAALIEALSGDAPPDPGRWEGIELRWDVVGEQLAAALATPIADETINEAGLLGKEALEQFDDTFTRAHDARETFGQYMEAFTETAETAAFYSGLARDISFCAAVGVAVVVAAPVVAGAAAAVGTGTLGLAAGSAGLAAFQVGATTVTMGAMGAGIEGTLELTATQAVQAGDALSDLLQGRSGAADNFDLEELADAEWEGMKRGFVDGVLGLAGAQAELLLASYASAAVRSVLGPGNSGLYAILLRRTLTRATSGGITGGGLGALQAGYRAAMDGKDLDGITADMETGFALGAGLGTVAGGVGGAVEARGADQLRQLVAAKLRERAVAGGQPAAIENDKLVTMLLDELRENPTAGNNQRLLELTPEVWKALHDPDTLAAALSEVWLEEHLLGMLAPAAAKERYGQAAMVIGERRGAPVVVLAESETYSIDRFYAEVVKKGIRFLDLSILKASPEHGAITHLIQDLAVDRLLTGTGVRAEQYHALLDGAVGRGGTNIGNDLWIELFDSLQQGINNPNVVFPAMREALEIK